MPTTVIIYEDRSKRRSKVTCEAMLTGITRIGDQVSYRVESDYRKPDADTAVFYGMGGNLRRVFDDYRAADKTVVCVDLGYWGRRSVGAAGRFKGYHKVSVNARHPTAYFQKVPHDDSRAKALGLELTPWRTEGKHILVAGMGAKAASFEGYGLLKWERGAIAAIREWTDRPIIFRPKPNCTASKPIEGTTFSPGDQPLADVLKHCHAVVTHHSNVAADALLAGIPTFCWHGVSAPMSLQDLRQIEEPWFPEDRQSWLSDVTWCQFNIGEMTAGITWRHLKEEGLIP